MATFLTQKNVKMMGIAGLVVITALGGAFVVQPTVAKIQSQATEISDAQANMDLLSSKKSGLQLAKDTYPEVQKVNATLVNQFPELAQVPELLDAITAGAVAVGINPADISSITFYPPTIKAPEVPVTPEEGEEVTTVSTGEYAEMEVNISITGSPLQIEQFMAYLNTMDRVMIISGFSVDVKQVSDSRREASLSLTGKTFIYKEILSPEQVAEQAKLDAENPTDEAPVDQTPITD